MRIFVERLGSHGSLKAYVHEKSPELSTADVRPAILIFPGGGYFTCSDREAEPIALAYAAEGYNAFVCRYATGHDTPYSESFKDAQAALAMLHEKADLWNIEKEKIAVIGFSAGGHLASAIGTMGEIRPSALILGYPVIFAEMGPPVGKEIPGTHEQVDEKTPPTFMFTARDDDVVPIANTMAFADALEKAGTPFELHVFSKGGHGFSLARPLTANGLIKNCDPVAAQWMPMSVEWLKTLWGDFRTDIVQPAFTRSVHSIGIETPLYVLLEHEECVRVLTEMLPVIMEQLRENDLVQYGTLQMIAHHSPDLLSQELLKQIEAALQNSNAPSGDYA